MKRKIFIGLAAVLALVVGFALYAVLIGNKKSPAQTMIHNG